jgi:SPP1 family predicted phage head-tail adaptor
MRAGDLDRTIVVQSFTSTDDGYGNVTETWTDKATLRAQLVQASTDEYLRDYGVSDETVTIFRTRWIDGVTLSDRVVYAGLLHNIKSVKEIGRRRGLELRTVSLDEAAT